MSDRLQNLYGTEWFDKDQLPEVKVKKTEYPEVPPVDDTIPDYWMPEEKK
jgi:hypothetical protein